MTEEAVPQPHMNFTDRKPLIQHNHEGRGRPTGQTVTQVVRKKITSDSQIGGHFPEDEPSEESDHEPELLLQPETRPISHEQLVVEVKGIYAGLVMVEAKCIDIDERQTAAAQEKDVSKKTELKNDQWQSLIALHKQV